MRLAPCLAAMQLTFSSGTRAAKLRSGAVRGVYGESGCGKLQGRTFKAEFCGDMGELKDEGLSFGKAASPARACAVFPLSSISRPNIPREPYRLTGMPTAIPGLSDYATKIWGGLSKEYHGKRYEEALAMRVYLCMYLLYVYTTNTRVCVCVYLYIL